MASNKAWIFGTPKYPDGHKAGDARITIVAAQPPGFGKFSGGASNLAFESIGGGEVSVQ